MSFHLVDAVFFLDLPSGDKVTLLGLSRYADHDGRSARPGLDDLADRTSASTSFLKLHLKRLETMGLITKVGGGRGPGNASEYEIAAERVYSEAVDNGWKDTRKGPRRDSLSSGKRDISAPGNSHMDPLKEPPGDPHSVLGQDSVSGDSAEAASGSVACPHPKPWGWTQSSDGSSDYFCRLCNVQLIVADSAHQGVTA